MDGYKRRTEEASFTTMCMVMDEGGRVAALNKIKGGYYGLTFPGGHVEEGESLYDCVIREVREEAGIDKEACTSRHLPLDGRGAP